VSGSVTSARRTTSFGAARSVSTVRRNRACQPCDGTRPVTASRCSRARSCADSGHGTQSGSGAMVSTNGQRVRNRVPECSGSTDSGDNKEPDSAAMRSRVVSVRGSVPGRCSL
jgi:hypothetical protein